MQQRHWHFYQHKLQWYYKFGKPQIAFGFDWKTTRTVSLDISSIAGNSPIKQAIKIEDTDGNLILLRNIKIEPGTKLNFQLPKAEKSVVITYNGTSETVFIGNGSTTRMMSKKEGSKGSKGSNGSKGGSGTCPCNGKMQNFSVAYTGPSGATVNAQDSKGSTPFQTFNNVQVGDVLKIEDPNSIKREVKQI